MSSRLREMAPPIFGSPALNVAPHNRRRRISISHNMTTRFLCCACCIPLNLFLMSKLTAGCCLTRACVQPLAEFIDKVKPVKAVVGDRATLAKQLWEIEIVNSSSIEELVQLADRISEEGVRAARARKSRVARMFSSKYVPDLQPLRAALANIHEIDSVSQQLLGEVEALVKDWKGDECLGPVLLKYAPALQCYGTYCANVGSAVAMIDTLMKPTKELSKTELKTKIFFQHAVDEVWGKGTDLRAVRGLVLAPTQHVPRLRGLAETILNATGSDHKDEKVMQEAVQALKQAESVINKMAGAGPITDKGGSAKSDHAKKIANPQNKARTQKEKELLARAAALIKPALEEYVKHKAALGQIKDRVTQANTDGKLLAKLHKHFRKMDKQSKGTLPMPTLKDGLKRHGINLTNEQIKVVRDEFDPRNEGVVQYKAFLEACADKKGSVGHLSVVCVREWVGKRMSQ